MLSLVTLAERVVDDDDDDDDNNIVCKCLQSKTAINKCSKCFVSDDDNDGGGGIFLACKDFGRLTIHSLSALFLLVVGFFFK